MDLPIKDEESQPFVGETTTAKTAVKPTFLLPEWFNAICVAICALFLVGVPFVVAYYHSHIFEEKPFHIFKPTTDNKDYRFFELSNGMKVLLISDPKAAKGAAALEVTVGSLANPPDLPGLAHFCEHLLFLGSRKFPELNTFGNFVHNHGGTNNAFTSNEVTNFHFEISSSAFANALEIFAHFFIDPIFTEEWVNSEISAVDGEYNIDLNDPGWKFNFMTRIASDPENPYSRFSIGSRAKLLETPQKINVAMRVKEFFETYYSSNLMSLVVFDKESLEEMEQRVKGLFSMVQNLKIDRPSYIESPRPYSGDYDNKLVQFMPITDSKTVSFVFTLDSSMSYAKENPVMYLHALISQEGEGSLSSVLQDKEYITSMSSGIPAKTTSFELYMIQFDLTDKGLEELDEVTKIVFAYLDLIKKKGINLSLFQQLYKMTKDSFLYTEGSEKNLMKELSRIAANLNLYDPKYVLSGNEVLYKFEESIISRFAEQFNTEGFMIFVSSSSFKLAEKIQQTPALLEESLKESRSSVSKEGSGTSLLKKKEKNSLKHTEGEHESQTGDKDQDNKKMNYRELDRFDPLYNVNYVISSLPSHLLKALNQVTYQDYPELSLEFDNKYLAYDFRLVELPCPNATESCIQKYDEDKKVRKPEKVAEDNSTTIWYQLERSYKSPRIVSYIALHSNDLQQDLNAYTTSTMWAQLVELRLQTEMDEMAKAGMLVNIDTRVIEIEGFSQPFTRVLKKILKEYNEEDYEEEEIKKAQEILEVSIQKELYSDPRKTAIDLQKWLLLKNYFTPQMVLDKVKEYNVSAFAENLTKLKSSLHLKSLFVGNLLESKAKHYATTMTNALKYQPFDLKKLEKNEVLNIVGKNLVYRVQSPLLDGNLTVIRNIYQDGPVELKNLACMTMLGQLFNPQAFSYLRTERGLGYVVSLSTSRIMNVVSMEVLVQTHTFTPNEVDAEIETFWMRSENVLNSMSDAEFSDLVKSFKEVISGRDKTLHWKAERYFQSMEDEFYEFDIKDKVKKVVDSLTKADLIAYFEKIFKSPRKLSVQLMSNDVKVPTELLPAEKQMSKTMAVMIKGLEDLKDFTRHPLNSTSLGG